MGTESATESAMSQLLQPVTADELVHIPEDSCTYELAQGRLIRMSKPGWRHGLVVMRLCLPLARFVEARGLGVVLPQDTGFLLGRDPDTVRGPDVAFVSSARLDSMRHVEGFLPGAPDLAVEVRSPNDRWRALADKAAEYLHHGARFAWIVDPRSRRVVVFRQGSEPRTLTDTDALDGADVVPGFQLPVARLFDGV